MKRIQNDLIYILYEVCYLGATHFISIDNSGETGVFHIYDTKTLEEYFVSGPDDIIYDYDIIDEKLGLVDIYYLEHGFYLKDTRSMI